MKNKFKTAQEEFWAGEFGNDYTDRNASSALKAGNINLFSKILGRAGKISSVIEFGANIGLNLIAMRALIPGVSISAVEINQKAVRQLKKIADIKVHHQTILEYKSKSKADLALIKGVLIHINPDELQKVYTTLYNSSKKYICIVEYYNPTPVEITYRGHEGRLFKRDFAGEFLDKYPDTRLVDYGFCYHRDPSFPLDDVTWFLIEKGQWSDK